MSDALEVLFVEVGNRVGLTPPAVLAGFKGIAVPNAHAMHSRSQGIFFVFGDSIGAAEDVESFLHFFHGERE